MYQYTVLLNKILHYGIEKEGRNGKTYSVHGHSLSIDLESFPLLTLKKTHFKSIVTELLWFLKGDTNIKYLNDNSVTIWDEWADSNGDLGPVYGKQWRDFGGYSNEGKGIDQIAQVIEQIKENPHSRRHIVSAWNPMELESQALPPCHLLFQFIVNRDMLDCIVYQRSQDVFLGAPFNIASYALLTKIIGQLTGYYEGRLTFMIGDAHLYEEHIPLAKEVLKRSPYPYPTVTIAPFNSIDELTIGHFTLNNYKYHPHIKAEVKQ